MFGMSSAVTPLALIALRYSSSWWMNERVASSSALEEAGRRLNVHIAGDGKDGELTEEELAMIIMIAVAIALGIYLVLIVVEVIFAVMYKNKVVDRRGKLRSTDALGGGDFSSGVFSCFEDMPTCLHACFCTWCRVGDTYATLGGLSYWQVLMMFVVAHIAGNIVGAIAGYGMQSFRPDMPEKDVAEFAENMSLLVYYLIVAAMFTSHRRKLRQKLGGDDDISCVQDFCCYYCCTDCIVAQEARELDAAMGQSVECCCNLMEYGGEGMVGNPVMANRDWDSDSNSAQGSEAD